MRTPVASVLHVQIINLRCPVQSKGTDKHFTYIVIFYYFGTVINVKLLKKRLGQTIKEVFDKYLIVMTMDFVCCILRCFVSLALFIYSYKCFAEAGRGFLTHLQLI